jgi:lipoprotein-anchoring transpeptidase ErfK/SrfK
MQKTLRSTWGAMLGAALLLGGCGTGDRDAQQDGTVQPQAGAEAPAAGQVGGDPALAGRQGQQPESDMRIEVDISARQLHVYRGGQRVESHPVAVGSEEWPTQTGEWTISQVVWNPRWIPPEEEWAEDRETKEPGDPDNPLGRAQLVYDAPRTIHGTNQPESVGQAVSHGSIRVTNDVAMQLARQAMEAGGAGRDESWYRQVRENRSQREDVSLPNPIPIRVHQGR